MVTQTDPLGKTTTTQYDAVGNVLKSTDRNGNSTIYSYDAINRRITMTDALGNITQWQYDPVGNLIKITDANTHATQYAYDAVNRPLKETYADGLSRSYTYDPVGNLLTRTDQKSQTTTYRYNDLYFLISRAYPFSGADAMTYDLSGRELSAQHGSWPDTFSYDGANRLIQTVQNGQRISYVYNIPGRTRQITYPGGRTITEHTDFRSRMDHINDAAYPQAIVHYTYDLSNNAISRNYRNGTTSAFSYNANNWTINMAYNNPATFAQFGYAYDNEGNKLYENKTPQNPAQSEGYQYDSTYRLINYQVGTLVGSTITVPITQTSYSLDPVGNWNSKTTNAVTQIRTHNADSELIKIDAQNLTYDADGNTLNDGTYTYAYDEENRLISVTRIAGSVVVGQYQYDALFRRVQKIANPAGTPSTTRYFYDVARVIEEQNSLGVTSATYVYGNYIDEVLTMDLGGNTYYYHQNALWLVEAITDSAGTPVERYSYCSQSTQPACDGYGFVVVTDGMGNPVPLNSWGTPHSAIANPYIFTGQRLDEESGLYFYRARYYDAFEGRFYQRDPREYVDGMNLYEYVADRPTFAADPLGTQKLSGSTVVIQGAPPIWGPCGGFLWPIRWALDAASKAGGWIVQKVNVRFNVTDCDGKKIDIKTLTNGRVDPGWWPFWEAWRVDKGQTQTTLAQIGRPADDFYGSEVFGACTKGDVQIEGTAQFYEGLTLPPDFKVGLALLMPNPMNPFTALLFYDTAFLPSPAGFLPATKAEPKLMGGTGVIKHNLKAAWNCCPVGHIENTVGGTYVGK